VVDGLLFPIIPAVFSTTASSGEPGRGVIVQGRVRAIVVHVSDQIGSRWPFRDTVHAPNNTEDEMTKRGVWGGMEFNMEYTKIGHCQR
jgi:hypothetical protein